MIQLQVFPSLGHRKKSEKKVEKMVRKTKQPRWFWGPFWVPFFGPLTSKVTIFDSLMTKQAHVWDGFPRLRKLPDQRGWVKILCQSRKLLVEISNSTILPGYKLKPLPIYPVSNPLPTHLLPKLPTTFKNSSGEIFPSVSNLSTADTKRFTSSCWWGKPK